MQLSILTSITGLLVLGYILELLRRQQLREKYAAIWLAIGLLVAPLGFVPDLLDSTARRLGVASGASLVLFAGFVQRPRPAGQLPHGRPRRGRVRCRRHRGTGELMSGDRRVLIILPAWNEEDGLPSVLREIQEQLPYVDTLVVDGGSADSTAAVAEAAGSAVAQLPFNLGVGGAMRPGYRYAQQHGYDVAIQVDADGQHDPAYIPALLERLATGEADLVIGA
ncbi:DUF2304 family protein, partial [Kitasatospora nipponensis]|uniref:DUF2304 family protein n=1 Tax=Kitasatospora nipponensis TaxID=258049 RepID=UPI0031D69E54